MTSMIIGFFLGWILFWMIAWDICLIRSDRSRAAWHERSVFLNIYRDSRRDIRRICQACGLPV